MVIFLDGPARNTRRTTQINTVASRQRAIGRVTSRTASPARPPSVRSEASSLPPAPIVEQTASDNEPAASSALSVIPSDVPEAQNAAFNTMRNALVYRTAKVSVQPDNGKPESNVNLVNRDTDSTYGTATLHTVGLVGYIPDPKFVSNDVDWFRRMTKRFFGGPVAIRAGPVADNRGGVQYSVTVKALTEMGQGQAVIINQHVRRAAPRITNELEFNIEWGPRIELREDSPAYIAELRSSEISVDYRTLSQDYQTHFGVDRAAASILADVTRAGMAFCDVTSFYSKLWLIYFHVMWGQENNNNLAAVNVVNDVCVAATFRPAAEAAAANWSAIGSAIARHWLIVWDRWASPQSRLVYWLAANGLPRFQSQAGEPASVCLLDGLHVPPNPVLFLNDGQAAVPVQGNIVPHDVILAIAYLARHRHEQAFAVAGYIRACCYFNRFRAPTPAGARQAYAATLEWKSSTWPCPAFANSLLIAINRYVPLVYEWARPEAGCLIGLPDREIYEQSAWIGVTVALSYSSALSVVNLRGDDLSHYAIDKMEYEWRRLDTAVSSLVNLRFGEILCGLDAAAAIIRTQLGFPSLGCLGFTKAAWNGPTQFLSINLTGANAWVVGWNRITPYPVDPLSMLWMTTKYFDLWGIVRAPTSFRISKEFRYAMGRSIDYFSPAHGDEVISSYNTQNQCPPGAPYVPLLMAAMMQGVRESFPPPTRWVSVVEFPEIDDITDDNNDEYVPAVEIDDALFIVRPGTLPMFSWRGSCFYLPQWAKRETPLRLWQLSNNKGCLISPSAGIEPTEHLIEDERTSATFDVEWAHASVTSFNCKYIIYLNMC